MDNCKIIEDLLPSYCDGLTGEESNALIRNHVASCPQCAAHLQKMLADQSIPILDHRERFSQKLREYERKHRSKVLAWTLTVTVAFLLMVLLWSNSEHIACWWVDAQMGGEGIQIADHVPVDEHKAVDYYIYHTNKGFQLVTLEKNTILNIWYYAGAETADPGELFSVAWFGESNWSRFVTNDTPMDVGANVNFDINYLYIGNDAAKLLSLDSSEIPGDVCVKINQVQRDYWIWVVSDNMDAINQLNIREKLLDAAND